jgi:hypothetical protein
MLAGRSTRKPALTADQMPFSRSTVANVETGRQQAPREFWQRCDDLLGARGDLLSAYDQLAAAIKRQARAELQQAHAQLRRWNELTYSVHLLTLDSRGSPVLVIRLFPTLHRPAREATAHATPRHAENSQERWRATMRSANRVLPVL